jgi:hypothetical protein
MMMATSVREQQKKIEKIIFLHEHHFSNHYFNIFGIKTLMDNGFDVEIWNFMPFIMNQEYISGEMPDPLRWHKHYLFHKKQDAISALSKLTPSCFIVSGIHYTPNTYAIYKMLSKKNLLCCSLLSMALPLGTMPLDRESFIKKLIRVRPKHIFHRVFDATPFEWLGIRPVSMVMAMGEKFFRKGYPFNNNTEIVWTHFYDYDVYLTQKNIPVSAEPKTGVFLDEYLPYHSDNLALNKPNVSPDEYFFLLRNFFDRVEMKYGFRIIIAAHPRSRYEDMPDMFGGRLVVRGKTAELVQRSGFVILHQSMSLNYAVLFRKPMIFVTTDELTQFLIEDPHPAWLANYFGKELHNLNSPIVIDMEQELTFHEPSYQKYQNDYIKKDGSPELPMWQIFADRIKNLSSCDAA